MEAVRLALEHCGEEHQRPCLLLSVDGFLTMAIPKARKIVAIFLPSVEAGMTDPDKAQIAVYKGADWRALARGKAGRHAVAAQSSEHAAVDAAAKSCAQKDSECRLHAIGNFRVAEE